MLSRLEASWRREFSKFRQLVSSAACLFYKCPACSTTKLFRISCWRMSYGSVVATLELEMMLLRHGIESFISYSDGAAARSSMASDWYAWSAMRVRGLNVSPGE